MNELESARKEINRIDVEMARLFEERMKTCKQIAAYKKSNGLSVRDPARETELINRNRAYITDPDIETYYVGFMRNTIDLSCAYQSRLMSGMKVTYCGTEGAYAYIAAKKMFPECELIKHSDFTDAYRAVENGECDCTVLPLENSYAGEALSQCNEYILRHGFETKAYSNTALAAKYVMESGDPTIAAIASEEAIAAFGLKVIESDINDSRNNTTRFASFSRSQNRPSSSGKRENENFIMVFTVQNEAGSLAKALNIIGIHGFNMRSLRSRPMKELQWNYYFYIEAEGNINTENGREMLQELSAICAKLKLIGSYYANNVK